jgi:hypothetical protein
MIKMERPSLIASEVFTTCISRIRDPALKARMVAITDPIALASQEFDELASQNRLHQILLQPIVGGLVTTPEMEAVYTQRMAKKGSPGRDAYDELFNSAPQNKCPLCGHRLVTTLDHHLPKTRYPALAVAPLNLIPACSDCNKSKLAITPQNANDETLHPYFDDIQNARWLYAEVEESSPAALRFYVAAPDNWSTVLTSRVRMHFRRFSLADLYAAEAADELLNIRHQLELIYTAGGGDILRMEMEERADSCRAVYLNSWRTATYEAFSQNEWFCNGGFI